MMRRTELSLTIFLGLTTLCATADEPAGLPQPEPARLTIEDRKIGIQLRLPPGFIEMPQIAEQSPNLSHTHGIPPRPESPEPIVFGVEPLRSPVAQVRLRPSAQFPANARISSTNWRGYEINLFEVTETVGEKKFTTFKAEIPLRQKAVMLMLVGPEQRREELRAQLESILATLQGETNWTRQGRLNEPQEWQPLTDSTTFWMIFTVAAMVIGVVMWCIVRYSQRGLGIGLSVVLWFVGNSLAQDPAGLGDWARVALLFGSLLKLAGSIGVVMSLVEFFIPRAESPPPADMNYSPGSMPAGAIPPVRTSPNAQQPPQVS